MAACACWRFGASASVIQSLDSRGLWTAVAGGYLVCICAHHIDMFYTWVVEPVWFSFGTRKNKINKTLNTSHGINGIAAQSSELC